LASAAKPWPIHREVVNLLNKEFFAQGDRERIELNIEPNVRKLLILNNFCGLFISQKFQI